MIQSKGKYTNKIVLACVAIAVGLAVYFFAPSDLTEPARRVAFIFVIAAMFWGFEIVPLYTTSLIVVLLETFLLTRPGGVLGMDAAGYKMFMVPFGSPIIMLFFGGFMLAAAMKKHQLDVIIARRLLKFFGKKPYFIMLGFMFSTAFLSMWMSNTATTAMMIAMVTPLLAQLDKDSPFRTGLILSIAFGANVGGIGTPVGTPPNAIAIGILADYGVHINFVSWMMMAVPLAFVVLILVSVILYSVFPSRRKSIDLSIPPVEVKGPETKMVAVVAIITVILWLTSSYHKIPSSMVALLAAGMLFSLHLLDREDMKRIDWDILVLMWGGLALGKGMEVSGLAHWIVGLPIFSQSGMVLVFVFCLLAVVLSTFMSNTAAANLLIPVVMSIPGESYILLAVTVALSCSFAMALPVSTPPNAIAFSTNMVRSQDMIKTGALISLISVGIVLIGFKMVISRILGL